MKEKRKRIVSMVTRMMMKARTVGELEAGRARPVDYEHEYHCAEHEHEEEPEPEGTGTGLFLEDERLGSPRSSHWRRMAGRSCFPTRIRILAKPYLKLAAIGPLQDGLLECRLSDTELEQLARETFTKS